MINRIVADSSGDITEYSGVEFRSVPLTISTDERSYVDDENIPLDEMIDYLSTYNGRSYTACPGTDSWLQAYEGADQIFVVTITSGLSGSFNAARVAAEMYLETHPDTKIHVFDSLSVGPEMRLMIDKISDMLNEGKSFEEIVAAVTEYRKYSRLLVVLESFQNLANNGRVNKAVAKIAGVLGIRIMATASLQGTIEVTQKCRGEKGALKKYIECMIEAGYEGGKVYISHCKNLLFAENLKEVILEHFPKAQILIYNTRGLCSYYAEKGGVLLGCECVKAYCYPS
jgi:DegV family protein with EDD domain